MNRMQFMPAIAVAAILASPGAMAAEKEAPKTPSPAATPGAPLFADPVVAKGKTLEIRRSHIEDAYKLLKANAAASGQVIPEDRRGFFEARLLDRLISTKLVVAGATAADKTKAKETSDKFIADAKNKMSSEEMFNLQLKAMGLTPAEFQERILEQAICDEVINRELRAQIKISDEAVKKYYEENPKDFETPEQVRAAHILITTKDNNPNPAARKDLSEAEKRQKKSLAESVLARARKGDDFARLAKEFSDDPGSKDKGGEYTFARGRMVPEFEAAAFSLAVNQISDLVTTAFGFHIIKVLEKLPPQKAEFAKVAADIKKRLEDQEVVKQMPDYLQKLRKEAGVEILEESLKVKDEPAPKPVPPAAK